MPLAEGIPLNDALKQTTTDEQYRGIVQAAILAVRALNAAGVYHLDLKPEHLLVETSPDTPPRVTIIDFGMAVQTGPESEAAFKPSAETPTWKNGPRFRGNYRYASIYQHLGFPTDAASDLQALLFILAEVDAVLPWFGFSQMLSPLGPLTAACLIKIRALVETRDDEYSWLGVARQIVALRCRDQSIDPFQIALEHAATHKKLPSSVIPDHDKKRHKSADEYQSPAADSAPKLPIAPAANEPAPALPTTAAPATAKQQQRREALPRARAADLEHIFVELLTDRIGAANIYDIKSPVLFGPIRAPSAKPQYEFDILGLVRPGALDTMPGRPLLHSVLATDPSQVLNPSGPIFDPIPFAADAKVLLLGEVTGLHQYNPANELQVHRFPRLFQEKLRQIENNAWFQAGQPEEHRQEKKLPPQEELLVSALRCAFDPSAPQMIAVVLLGSLQDYNVEVPAFSLVHPSFPHVTVLTALGRLFVHVEHKNQAVRLFMTTAMTLDIKVTTSKTQQMVEQLNTQVQKLEVKFDSSIQQNREHVQLLEVKLDSSIQQNQQLSQQLSQQNQQLQQVLSLLSLIAPKLATTPSTAQGVSLPPLPAAQGIPPLPPPPTDL